MDFIQRLSQQLREGGSQLIAPGTECVVLGRIYRMDDENEKMQFYRDVCTRLNFTYRTKFVPISRSPDGPSPISFQLMIRDGPLSVIENALLHPDCFNTDIGWGCMIRTGQSLLGNALQRLRHGREFRVTESTHDDDIIQWFKDTPDAPFSLHNFVKKGVELADMKPGQWFGPAATSRSIQSLICNFPQCGIDHCIVSVSSADIYKQDVEDMFDADPDSNLLILFGVKLGVSAVNASYWEDIRRLLNSKFSVGIAGGRPSSSLYFFGYQNQELLYFDPHTPQPSLIDDAAFNTCHSIEFGKLELRDMDPSMLIGIMIEGERDWENWARFTETSKIFNILEERSEDCINVDVDIDGDENDENIGGEVSGGPDGPLHGSVIEADYVDISSLALKPETSNIDNEYQEIKCKRQKIMVMSHDGCPHPDESRDGMTVEAERVLVASETVPVHDS
ncbi:cysteine protease ATG4 KNAG_0F00890 [Huiozyma naganishii CBS 8797]|uniref:Cysteine protease n=1 Tax=Huiozyma naganishii (strain ATCC MYA-139 / BCRC 22969 / CBS 8797 / KCTC 17520 / NBRC 10181 / NCYC 3082 / Yp74L-3) TaxID=1071383 RepID=J7RMH4_HUIN7|nr:hypothetical protein KNAG_0F00890 [Kazachstania naganishii CBS 8797]CCK70758.1 hypothetical protein KNAG_0F00890 [Kazachstania naganishii CBS 8797]